MVYQKKVTINLKTGKVIKVEEIPLPDEDPKPYREAQLRYYASVLKKGE